MSKYFYEFTALDTVDPILMLIPLVIWTYIIKTFLMKSKIVTSINKYLLIVVLAIPYVLIIHNSYQLLFVDKGPSYPPTFGFCLNTDVNKTEKQNGIIGKYNLKCNNNNTSIVKTNSRLLINRFYYLNYTLLLLVLMIVPLSYITSKRGFRKYVDNIDIFKQHKILLKLICLAALFSIIGFLAPIFSNNHIISFALYKPIVSFLNISVSLLILIFLIILKVTLLNKKNFVE